MSQLNLWYYRNPKGLVAFSADEGESVCIPSGKVCPGEKPGKRQWMIWNLN